MLNIKVIKLILLMLVANCVFSQELEYFKVDEFKRLLRLDSTVEVLQCEFIENTKFGVTQDKEGVIVDVYILTFVNEGDTTQLKILKGEYNTYFNAYWLRHKVEKRNSYNSALLDSLILEFNLKYDLEFVDTLLKSNEINKSKLDSCITYLTVNVKTVDVSKHFCEMDLISISMRRYLKIEHRLREVFCISFVNCSGVEIREYYSLNGQLLARIEVFNEN